MKVYFAGAIRGGRDQAGTYKSLITFISAEARVLTEHIGVGSLSSMGESELTDREIYVRDLEWLKGCDAVIAEVTTPSLGVGYELAYAEALNKPVLCLYHRGASSRLSAMISGNRNFMIEEYDGLDDATVAIARFLKENIK